METILVGTAVSIIGLWLGSIEVRMKNIAENSKKSPTREEVRDEIILRQESLKVLQQEIKEDIQEIKRALEKIIK